MSHKTAVIIFRIEDLNLETDLEVPLNISAHELILALDEAFSLGIDPLDMRSCYLKCRYPLALLRGNRTLADFGIRNASVISFDGQADRDICLSFGRRK